MSIRPRRHAVLLAAAAAFAGGAAAATAPAAGQPAPVDALTPEGRATVRERFFGAISLEERLPEVLVGWRVTVGPGGNAGPVRLRVLRAGDSKATVVGSGPVEQLPATPGTYSFGLRRAIPYDYRDFDLALDQEVGGHAIVKVHPRESPDAGVRYYPSPWALDVFQPRLAEHARGAPYAERRRGHELLLRAIVETDIDEDRRGDDTQDVGDLKLLGARVAGRRGRKVVIRARVRNVGTTVRDLPGIVPPRNAVGCLTSRRLIEFWRLCPGPRLAPGEQGVLRILLGPARRSGRVRLPARVRIADEGTDSNPADNAAPLERARR